MKKLALCVTLIACALVVGFFVGKNTADRNVSIAAEQNGKTSDPPMSFEGKETGIPGATMQFRAGPFVLMTSEDYSTFVFAKQPPGKIVPQFLLMERASKDSNEVTSDYFGFGGDPTSLMSLTADREKGTISNIVCDFPEKLAYPYEHSPTRYTYFDRDADGLWDDFIDIKNKTGYKREHLNWIQQENNNSKKPSE